MEPAVVGASCGSEGDARMKRTMDDLVSKMSTMELSRPEVLRCTYAFQAIRALAVAEKIQSFDAGALYAWSRQTTSISEFWTHSWHGSKRAKICLLLVANNGLVAICLGSCAAVLLSLVLWAVRGPAGATEETMPTLQGQYHAIISSTRMEGLASSLLGLLVTSACLLLWRRSTPVFLDRVCVHQTDTQLKLAGLVSMGAILQKSNVLMVCWDVTYSTRLWCLFELAAFLKSHGRQAKVVVRPAVLGPVTIGIFAGFEFAVVALLLLPRAGDQAGTILARIALILVASVAAFWCPLSALRSFYRSIDTMEEQLRQFRLDNATCHCCTVGHVKPDGRVTLCDRQVIERCLLHWFGSVESFEECVQTTVSKALARQLGQFSFPISWMFGCSCPLLWTFATSAIRQPFVGTFFILAWSCAIPAIFMIGASAAYKLRGQFSSTWQDGAATLACVLACALSYMCMETLAALLSNTLLTYWQSVAAFALLMALITLCIWCCWSKAACRRKHLQKQLGNNAMSV